ncbi:hypothetical protein FNV43_RR03300 [Rhamnella rubrinervis]|uniref:Cation/H+ exchanger transmembrane domain-containing protein n=1 Tax=Rhamnella rubrinervis TaxID=2594499 RepID=A0A8K0HHG8_9ROSA|nr:hypothetical protein FNV43_RR03300 [Rhamnella rubrinervis]
MTISETDTIGSRNRTDRVKAYEIVMLQTPPNGFHHLVLHKVLPRIVSRHEMNLQHFPFFVRRCIVQMFLLPGPGVLISTFCIGSALKFTFPYDWSWKTSLLLGGLLSATDSVAVVAILNELGASKKLSIGLAYGTGSILWLGSIFNDIVIEITLPISLFYVAVARTAFEDDGQQNLHHFWEMVAYIANTLIFILSGVVITGGVLDNTTRILKIYSSDKNFGGVENHIYYLSRCLLKLGHKVVVLTHASMETLSYAKHLPNLLWDFTNYKDYPYSRKDFVVFTDHSLYGFADVGSIHMNKVLQFTLADVFVMPNAIDTAMFKPASQRPSGNEIIIVVMSKLVYRKGADLLVEVIPEVCCLNPNLSYSFLDNPLAGLQVLPDDMIVLAKPDPSAMVQAIKKVISILPKIDPQIMHNRMKELYRWHNVARRTEIVYDRALQCSNQSLVGRLSQYAKGKFMSDWMLKYMFCEAPLKNGLSDPGNIEEVPEFTVSRRKD